MTITKNAVILGLCVALAAAIGWIAHGSTKAAESTDLMAPGAVIEHCGHYPGQQERGWCLATFLLAKCEKVRQLSKAEIEAAFRRDPDLWGCEGALR